MRIVKSIAVIFILTTTTALIGCRREAPSQSDESGKKNGETGNILLAITKNDPADLKSTWVTKLDNLHDQIEAVAKKAAGVPESGRAEVYKKISKLYEEHGNASKKLEAMKTPASSEWNAGKKGLQQSLTKLKGTINNVAGDVKKALADAEIDLAKQKLHQKYRAFLESMENAMERAETQIDILVNKARSAPTKVKADVYKQLSKVYQERTTAKKELATLRTTAGEGWEATGKSVMAAMGRLDAAVQAVVKLLE